MQWNVTLCNLTPKKIPDVETDHNIVIAKLLSRNTLDKRAEAIDRRLENKRTIFNYELMNDKLWEEY